MRPTWLAVFPALLLMCSSYLPQTVAAASPRLTATAALLMDAKTGAILFETNAHEPLPMASTTKIMTGLLGLELLRPHELVRVSSYAASMQPSKIYLKPGELLSAEDLLQAILLSSANDASVALAEHVSGSEEAFARLMTRRARELGARNTRFENASGLPADGHYSTAYDLALLLRYAMQRADFSDIMGLTTTRIVSQTGRVWQLRNHNRLLGSFPGAIGGKPGFTRAAKKTYVGMAERAGRTLIVSVLGSSDLWGDTRRLLEYGFTGEDTDETRLALNNRTKLLASAASPPRRPKPKEATAGNAPTYTVQVAAFQQQQQAHTLRKTLQRRGYEAYVTASGLHKKRWFRVRVGEFETHSEAKRLAEKLSHQLRVRAHVATAD